MDSELEQLRDEALAAIAAAADETAVEQARIKYLGQSGTLTTLSKGMKDVSKDDKPRIGKLLNDMRNAVTARSTNARRIWLRSRMPRAFAGVDATLPGIAARARLSAPHHAASGPRHPDFPPHGFRARRRAGHRDGVALFRRAQHARRPSRAQ